MLSSARSDLFTTGGQGPVRAQLVNPPNANVITIDREGKVWLRQEEHDIDLATVEDATHDPVIFNLRT